MLNMIIFLNAKGLTHVTNWKMPFEAEINQNGTAQDLEQVINCGEFCHSLDEEFKQI